MKMVACNKPPIEPRPTPNQESFPRDEPVYRSYRNARGVEPYKPEIFWIKCGRDSFQKVESHPLIIKVLLVLGW